MLNTALLEAIGLPVYSKDVWQYELVECGDHKMSLHLCIGAPSGDCHGRPLHLGETIPPLLFICSQWTEHWCTVQTKVPHALYTL